MGSFVLRVEVDSGAVVRATWESKFYECKCVTFNHRTSIKWKRSLLYLFVRWPRPCKKHKKYWNAYEQLISSHVKQNNVHGHGLFDTKQSSFVLQTFQVLYDTYCPCLIRLTKDITIWTNPNVPGRSVAEDAFPNCSGVIWGAVSGDRHWVWLGRFHHRFGVLPQRVHYSLGRNTLIIKFLILDSDF